MDKHMELQKRAEEIKRKIKTLEKGRSLLQGFAENKAETSAVYEKELAKTIIKLKNGEELELEGKKVIDPPATTPEKIARGVCWKYKLASEQAEAEYKLAIEKMKSIQSELNGFQSIFRYLDEK